LVEVVVRRDLVARAGARVEPRTRRERVPQRREGRAQPVEPAHLAGRYPHQRDQVVAFPRTARVRLAEPPATAAHQCPPERGILHRHDGRELGITRPERAARTALDDVDPPGPQLPEEPVDQRAREHRRKCSHARRADSGQWVESPRPNSR
jgi:hypothetical protein